MCRNASGGGVAFTSELELQCLLLVPPRGSSTVAVKRHLLASPFFDDQQVRDVEQFKARLAI